MLLRFLEDTPMSIYQQFIIVIFFIFFFLPSGPISEPFENGLVEALNQWLWIALFMCHYGQSPVIFRDDTVASPGDPLSVHS